jgi:hypothetical protein
MKTRDGKVWISASTEPWKRAEKISKQSIEPSGYYRQQSLGREWKKSANRALNQVGIIVNRALEESGKNQQTEH